MRQKDWIIYNNRTGNLWCLAIRDDGDGWYLMEWVNFRALPSPKLRKMVNMGYHTMLYAATKNDKYEWVIGKYMFSPSEMDLRGYWKALVPEGYYGKKETHSKINKSEFEKEVNKLFKSHEIEFSS